MKFLTILQSIVVICLSITTQAQSPIVIDQIIAVIGDEMIKQSDIDNQAIQMKQFGAKDNDIKPCKIFEDMLFQKLLVHQSKLDSIQVSDSEIDAEINRRIEMFIGEAGSLQKL